MGDVIPIVISFFVVRANSDTIYAVIRNPLWDLNHDVKKKILFFAEDSIKSPGIRSLFTTHFYLYLWPLVNVFINIWCFFK